MIRDGSIQTMFDTGVTIGDELLQKALGRSADSQMKSIVATIQKEQNRIIRNVNSRMLIVQGAAGSGKTSAALQRVAYLLYRYRGFLKADQIVLFSPNPMFNSYVASVLPELGEENMQQTTFHEFLEYSLGAIFKLEGPFEQMEYVLTAEKNTGFEARLEGIRYKASGAFLQAIHNYKVHLEHEGMIFRDLIFQNRILISSEQIKRHFYSFEPSIRLSNRMELLKDWLVKEVVKLEIAERQADWVQDELDYLDKDQYQKAYVKSRSQQEDNEYSFDDAELEEDILRQMVVKEHFKPLRRFLRELKFADVIALYRQMFENVELFQKLASDGLADGIHLPELWEDIVSQTIAKLNEKELFHEDSTPFLYLKELVEGFQTNTQVRHVLLDEAQDYSPFQFEFLKRLFPRARMTVLGDFNQAIFTHSTSLIDNSPIAQLYGEAETERIILTQSYRSTHEIVEFTRGMLADGANILPFNRHGDIPEVISLKDDQERALKLIEDLKGLQTQGFDTIAVLCKTAVECENAYSLLNKMADDLPFHFITKDTLTFEKGISVIPSYLAKGVEFDAVLLYDASASNYHRESERKLFYTACTRAMHQLKLYTIGEPSRFITEVDSTTYTFV